MPVSEDVMEAAKKDIFFQPEVPITQLANQL